MSINYINVNLYSITFNRLLSGIRRNFKDQPNDT